jgi:hypothetical protein
MNSEGMSKQANTELYRLSKGFKSLTIDHKKRVLKTARGLLRVQRACKTVTADKTWHSSLEGKNGYKTR